MPLLITYGHPVAEQGTNYNKYCDSNLPQQSEKAVHKQRTSFMWNYGLTAVDLLVFIFAAFKREKK